VWTLASLILPNAPDDKLKSDADPITQAYQAIHIMDMVHHSEVAFK
jgi:hypothetical protein